MNHNGDARAATAKDMVGARQPADALNSQVRARFKKHVKVKRELLRQMRNGHG